MTKIYLHILAGVVAALTLAACDKEDAEPKAVRVYPSFSAIIEGAGTRAYDTSWEADDKIGIYGGGATNISHTHQGNGSFKVTNDDDQIIFTDDSEVKFSAYYPYGTPSTNVKYPGKIATYATTNISQTPANQKKFDYLWAEEAYGSKANPDVKFKFTHQMSKITLVFTSEEIDVSNITSYSIGGLYLKGTFDPLNGDCAPYVTSTTSTSSATMTLKNYDDAKIEDGKPAPPIIVFPQQLKSNPVTLSVTGTAVGIGTITGSISFPDGELKSGNEYRFTITIRKTGITFSKAEIARWDPVDRGDTWEAW